ncbi:biotin--[acetyl-CoA-carboxylase] ligase [Maribacter thermophilus]|uniref:biotin--[acetyl-CoA-carboxylase] ligase n=1 Tax=Maribacter thermophilus TaxID=1197874 RepID=UPI0006410BE5|nr:biotin--[acetyl-CoA-carboxylase] ligase [Maribacter thermophilus]
MQIIKLSATESTNTYLKELWKRGKLHDYTVVVTKDQTKGKGQMGAVWQSEAGKNLTFSVLKIMDGFDLKDKFLLNMYTSMAVFDTLYAIGVPRLAIKWPNDILSGSSKLCGILIENIVAGTKIKAAIIGIGLNVNQTDFSGSLKASSVKGVTNVHFDLDDLLGQILENLQKYLINTDKNLSNPGDLYEDYHSRLFRLGVASTFQKQNGTVFTGIIEGVSLQGKLLVRLEDEHIHKFDLKEVRLLY